MYSEKAHLRRNSATYAIAMRIFGKFDGAINRPDRYPQMHQQKLSKMMNYSWRSFFFR